MNLTNKQRNITFIVFMIYSIIGSFLQNSLTIALPVIMQDFRITASLGQWLTTGYILAISIMIPTSAFLIRRFSSRTLFFTSVFICIIGAFLCACTQNFALLLFGRILQACGGGVILPLTQVSILTIYPPEERGTMMGIYGLAISVAPIASPALAGIIIDAFNWRVIFWGAIIILTFAVLLALPTMKSIIEPSPQKLDILSLLLCATGLSCLLLGLGNMGTASFFSVQVGLAFVIGLATLFVFCKRQLGAKNPFLDLRVFFNKTYAIGIILSSLLYAAMVASGSLLPIYLQSVGKLSATSTSMILLPSSIALMIINPIAGKLYDKFGMRRLSICGGVLLLISCVATLNVSATVSAIYIAVFYTIRLIATGLMLMPLLTFSMTKLLPEELVHGTAAWSSLNMASGAIATAVLMAIMTYASKISATSASISINPNGINAAFMGIAVISIVLLIASLFVEKDSKSKVAA